MIKKVGKSRRIKRLPEEDLARIRRSCLMDDAYMRKFFTGDKACIQLVLRIILGRDDLIVKSVKVQRTLRGPAQFRSIRLDVHVVDGEGREYDVEVQRARAGANPRRARFHSALLDVNMLRTKQDFSELRESIVIFITEEDVLEEGQPLYRIDRRINGARPFNDGSTILYVNASVQDLETELGRLMHDFTCADADEMYHPLLAERTRFFKETEEGMAMMSSVWEEAMQEKLAQGVKQGAQQAQEGFALRMIQAGKLAFQEIAEYSGLSLRTVRALAKTVA